MESYKKLLAEREGTLNQQLAELSDLRSKPTTSAVITQTEGDPVYEAESARCELEKAHRTIEMLYTENQAVRETLQRAGAEHYRLVED